MSGGLRHHSDAASGPELCGWIQQSSKKDRYCLEPTSASALRASYATKLQKQSSIYLDIADVVRDVEKLGFEKMLRKTFALGCPTNDDLNFLGIFYPQILVRFTRNRTFSTDTSYSYVNYNAALAILNSCLTCCVTATQSRAHDRQQDRGVSS